MNAYQLTQYDQDQLKYHCRRTIESYVEFGTRIDNPQGELFFQDNGADILAVGHLDYVERAACAPRIKRGVIRCGQLDDRLGVWSILHLLPKLTDVKYDVLLCDCEEIGSSTAEWFAESSAYTSRGKQYRYMFELDRAGDDCVTYQYDSDEWDDVLTSMGWDTHWGSFSDISSLEDLLCCGVNFGIGYHNQHSKQCWAELKTVVRQCERVAEFLESVDGSHPYDPSTRYRRSMIRLGWESDYSHYIYDADRETIKAEKDKPQWETADDPDWVVCPTCNDILDGYQTRWHYCPLCGTDI